MKHRAKNSLEANGRLFYVDIVRFFSILFIVAGHIWPSSGLSVAVFIFMILSGYLWRDGRTVKDDVKRKSQALWGPYISWGLPLLVAVVVYEILVKGSPAETAFKIIVNTLWGGMHATQPFTSFWYFSAIWFSIIIYRFMRNSSKIMYYSLLAAALIISVFFGEDIAHLPLGVGVAFVSVIFFSIGQGWRGIPERYRENIFIMIPLFVLLSVVALGGLVEPMVLKSGNFGTPVLSIFVYSLIALSLISITKNIANQIFAWCHKFIYLIVSCATPIILLHPVLIWIWEGISMDSISPIGRYPLFVAGVFVPLMVAVVIRYFCKDEYSKYLVP